MKGWQTVLVVLVVAAIGVGVGIAISGGSDGDSTQTAPAASAPPIGPTASAPATVTTEATTTTTTRTTTTATATPPPPERSDEAQVEATVTTYVEAAGDEDEATVCNLQISNGSTTLTGKAALQACARAVGIDLTQLPSAADLDVTTVEVKGDEATAALASGGRFSLQRIDDTWRIEGFRPAGGATGGVTPGSGPAGGTRPELPSG